MKKLIAFAFAAAVAVGAFGEGASAPEEWYTPDGWEKKMVKGGYSDKSKSYPVIVKLGNDKKLNAVWGDPKPTNDGIVYAVESALKAQWKAENASDSVKKLADTVYNQGAMNFKADNNGVVHVYAKDATGKDVDKGEFPQLGYKFDSVELDGFKGLLSLTYNGKLVGPNYCPLIIQPSSPNSIQQKYDSDCDWWYHEILGWDNPSSYHSLDNLTASLKANPKGVAQNYQLVARSSTGGLNYVDLGTLTTDGGGIADECSITTNANGNAGKMALKGYHDDTTEVGAIPYCALNEMGWLNPGTNGAILVSGIGAPRFTAKTSRNYYYGTSKPADPGETVLGWHELPNVTTNYVEGDERTITADNTIDEESGEICKKLKLFAEPSGSAFTPATVYGAYMDGEGHLAWQPIIGDKIAPLLADGITTTNNNGKVGICGFNDAQTLSYLRKASSNSVEWASLGGLVAARHGIVLEQNTNSQFIIAMQNYTNRATRSTHTAQNNVLLSRNEDGDLEWLTDVDFVGLESVIGIGAVKAEPDGQVSSAYDVKLRPSSAYGTVITGVDENGNWTRASIEPMVTNMFDKIRAETITNLVNDFYLLKAGDKMTGSLEIQSGISAASGDIANITNVNATIAHAEVDDLIVTNGCWLPYADKTMVQTATNETGEAVYFTLDDYVGFASAPAAELAVANATNAMAQAWTVGQLTTTGTTELNAATTIGGKAAVLVDDPPEGQPKIVSMKIENDKLVITDANGVEHRFTPDSL